MVILIIGFQILRLFCVVYGICAGRDFILQVHLIYFCTAPSIDAWSMAEMLWQRIHEIFIYYYNYSCKFYTLMITVDQ